MPIMREILFAIFCTCGFQLMCSSSVNPKKLNSETRSSGSEFNSSAGTRCSIFLCGWWKIMNLVLLTFTDNLFISSGGKVGGWVSYWRPPPPNSHLALSPLQPPVLSLCFFHYLVSSVHQEPPSKKTVSLFEDDDEEDSGIPTKPAPSKPPKTLIPPQKEGVRFTFVYIIYW